MTVKKNDQQAAERNDAGLVFYENWDIEQAIAAFRDAVAADPDNPEYHLNLARAYVRSGDYGTAMNSLGEYLRTETQEDVATRFEKLFSSALDSVETQLIEVMPKLNMDMKQIGKAIQMWLEYRITIGRRPLRLPKPELWAAAITYAIFKVNIVEQKRAEVAEAFQVNERSLKSKYEELVTTLDLMPADYRYFTGEENPLDRLVEAANLLDDMDRRFQDD
jgi:tetratricopeptide (TPR) repeat protein